MSSAPASLEGLGDLLESRFSLSVVGEHLVVNDVWYVDAAGGLAKGHVAAPLTLVTPTKVGLPKNHQVLWDGAPPCHADRSPIPFAARPVNLVIGGTVYGSHLSNKPPEGLPDYTSLVEHYVTLISGPAEQLFGVTPRTGAVYDTPPDVSPFKLADTFSARAELNELNRLLADDRVAIIGLGGTGSFVLDFMVKTPVYSIDAYDFDVFQVHNGFRTPGGVPFELFGQPKTTFHEAKYGGFRHRLQFHRKRVGAGDEALFAGTTFAFVCIDDGAARKEICALLMRCNVPFVDVGMGVEKERGRLDGLLRTTLFTADTAKQAEAAIPFDNGDEAGAYRVFVQIGELNALNAATAVIRYKQFRGFYADDAGYYNTLLSVGSSNWVGIA